MASKAVQELRKAGVLDNGSGHWKDGWFAGDDVYRYRFENGAALFVDKKGIEIWDKNELDKPTYTFDLDEWSAVILVLRKIV